MVKGENANKRESEMWEDASDPGNEYDNVTKKKKGKILKMQMKQKKKEERKIMVKEMKQKEKGKVMMKLMKQKEKEEYDETDETKGK